MEIKELTRAEEQLMQVLWQLEKGFVKDVIEQLPEPKVLLGIRLMAKAMSIFPSLEKMSTRILPPIN